MNQDHIPSLKETISIEGTLLMLDDTTPHVAVPVQAIHDGKVIATTFSFSLLPISGVDF